MCMWRKSSGGGCCRGNNKTAAAAAAKRKRRHGADKNKVYVDPQQTQSILEKQPTAALSMRQQLNLKEVDEVSAQRPRRPWRQRRACRLQENTLFGYSGSMSERLFEKTPPRDDSDIERAKITGERARDESTRRERRAA